MRSWEFLLVEVSEKIKQQTAARWKSQDPDLTDDNIRYYLDRWDRFSPKFPVDRRDITRLTFQDVEKLIDGAVSRQELKGKSRPQGDKNPADAVYNKNNLEIYKGDLREKCILYGQGYKWCISRSDSTNLFYSYRMRSESVFYFVFDLDRPQEDPWHAVVIYVDPKNVYHVATALNTGDEKMSWDEITSRHPKLKNLQAVFKPQPLTASEREDYIKYQKPRDLDQYQQLSLDEKYRYIMFGHKLSDEQQAATPGELISTYAKNNLFDITKDTWYSRLNDGDRRKIEQSQIEYFKSQNLEGLIKILDTGIRPSESVLTAAVTKDPQALYYILKAGIRPTEETMIAAVTKSGEAIKHILDTGLRPSEAVMLAAAKRGGHSIKHTLKAGIRPTEEIMRAAVNSYKPALDFLRKAGIKPSEAVIAAAGKNP